MCGATGTPYNAGKTENWYHLSEICLVVHPEAKEAHTPQPRYSISNIDLTEICRFNHQKTCTFQNVHSRTLCND